ncbi:MAG: efflux RND transporter permease subunit, partial [Cytophagales bacterium]|nr:efflux RND transporter permease subunit [Cytophagales bacterium]
MAKQRSKQKIKKEFGLSTLAVNNTTSVVVLAILIALGGINSYRAIPKESFPEVVIPTIFIGTSYFGNSPVDIENLITRPIEKELKSLSGVKDIKSTSIQDYSNITVEFTTGYEVAKALQEVKDAVDKAKSELPSDLDTEPNVFEVNFAEIPIMFVNLSGDYSIDELKAYAEFLEDEIEKLPEISKAEVRGVREREIKISADPYKMEAMQVTFADIEKAVAAENKTISGGDILADGFRRSLRIMGEYTTPDEINKVIVKNEDNNIVYLKEVANVLDDYEERKSYARSNKLPVVTVEVVKRSGENLLDAASKIKAIIAQAQENRFPEELVISINNDMSKTTQDQVDNLENSIISGVILVVVVLLFFLGLRNALFVGIAIPMSMFMAFMLLHAFGVTLNIVVLFSLVLALGMLVDNGIVVVENIYRLHEKGHTPIQAAKEGVGEVALAIIASTATTLAAFLPLVFWEGLMGEFMKYLPITLITVLASSLFVALVVNPVITSLFIRPSTHTPPKKRLVMISIILGSVALICYLARIFIAGNLLMLLALFLPLHLFVLTPATNWFQKVFLTQLENIYYRLMHFSLRSPYLVFGGTVLLLFLSVFLLGLSAPKVIFFPENEPNYINIFIEKPVGTAIEATNKLTEALEDEIIELLQPYQYMVESVMAQVGEGTSDPIQGPSIGAAHNKARITIFFVEFEYRKGVSTAQIMEDIRKLTARYPGVQITVDKEQNGPPVGKPISVEVSGEDYERLITITHQITKLIKNAGIQGIEELKTDLEIGKPELLIHVDRDRAGRAGLSTARIASELRTALFGKKVSKFKDGEDEYDIQLRLKDEFRYDISTLLNKKISFRNEKGKIKTIPIASLADITYSSTYGAIKRKNLDKVIIIFSNVTEGYNANEINQAITTLLQDFDMPEGYHIKFGGEQEEQQKSMDFLSRALLIAVFLIFLILVTQFNAISAPFIIMASVILSTIGVFLGLFIFNMDFVVIMTGIGIISLAGVVVNNAIVLVDYTALVKKRKQAERNLSEGELLPYDELLACITTAGKTRLRPVLLTAITTVLGLIPLAMGVNINFFTLLSDFNPQFYFGGDNAAFWGPMAWTVIFGLIFATFLTLVVVPVMYLITQNM